MHYGALASRPENGEPIDISIFEAYEHGSTLWDNLKRVQYVPFDPVNKKTIASIVVDETNSFRAVKGTTTQPLFGLISVFAKRRAVGHPRSGLQFTSDCSRS
jgi:phage terminase large subunit-like protein